MEINVPAKILQVLVTAASALDNWPFDDGLGDQFWDGGSSPKPYQWELVGTVTPQIHSSHLTRKPDEFNGLDLFVGDYIAGATTGLAVKIISISAKTEITFTIIVEDVFRYNTFRSANGTGIFQVPGQAVIFETNEDGDPMVDPLPVGVVSSDFFPNLNSRFKTFRLQENFQLNQTAHGFNVGEPISIDPITRLFEVADNNSFDRLLGTVSIAGPGPNEFLLKPTTKIVENFEPALPGLPGDFIFADPLNPGTYTTNDSGRELFLQLTAADPTMILGTVANPTVTISNQLEINDVVVTFTGTTIDNAISDILVDTNLHGVTPSKVLSATSVSTNAPDLAIGAVASFTPAPGPSTATINGVLVIFDDDTDGQIEFGQPASLDSDMARVINAAEIPDIVASAAGGAANLTLTNTAGGAITIVNVNNDRDGTPFAGPASASGLALNTVASTDSLIKLTRNDGGGIILVDVTGAPRLDLGIVSAQNGRLPLGLIIEQGIRKGDMFVVANITARDNLTVLIGDQAMVLDKGDGEWGLFLFDGTVWLGTSTEESARVDSRTLTATVNFNSASPIVIGEVNPGVRVSPVTVEVITPFDGTPTIGIGDVGDTARLFSDNDVDLSSAGTYESNPSFQFPGPNDENIIITFTSGGATVGQAIVTITYS